MPSVLTTLSNVTCGHPPGLAQVQSQAKLAVGGGPVLLEAGIRSQRITACGTPLSTNSIPCQLVSSVTAGLSTKLRAGGQPVVLQTLKGTTNGTVGNVSPQLLLAGVPNQAKLTSI
jgi:hypothetical protein